MCLDSGKLLCAVGHSGVGVNLIGCFQYKLWVQKKCSSIPWLVTDQNNICPRCRGKAALLMEDTQVDVALLDVEASFCYLQNMLCAGSGSKLPIATIWLAQGKFWKLLSVLTTKHRLPTVHGKCSLLVNDLPSFTVVKHGPVLWFVASIIKKRRSFGYPSSEVVIVEIPGNIKCGLNRLQMMLMCVTHSTELHRKLPPDVGRCCLPYQRKTGSSLLSNSRYDHKKIRKKLLTS